MAFLLSEKFNTLQDLLKYEIADLYDAEKRITEALPQLIEAAHSQQLQGAFRQHLSETEEHVHRLERVFELMGEDAKPHTCDAMKGLIKEGEEIINAEGDPNVLDAALIAAAQRVEHYEIAGYGVCRTFAQYLGMTEAADLLQQTLDEEGAADRKLTEIAEQGINANARNNDVG